MSDKTAEIARELLPCPFCGSRAEIERYGDRRQSTIYACTVCSCRLETGEEWDHGRDWNQRAALTTHGAEERRAGREGLEEAAKFRDLLRRALPYVSASTVRKSRIVQEITAALASSPAPAPGDAVGDTEGWRSRGTAPKDGRTIIIAFDTTSEGRVSSAAAWDGRIECWEVLGGYIAAYDLLAWQPLPLPPAPGE